MDFYPRPPRGGRRRASFKVSRGGSFLSTPSARRATRSGHRSSAPLLFLSTPSARRATHFSGHRQGTGEISIHALREEGDSSSPLILATQRLFLSTPSARRATISLHIKSQQERISIHALREEGDPLRLTQKLHIGRFLSTPSARRATGRLCLTVPIPMISIHALREEGDWPPVSTSSMYSNFYPRPPRGGRPNTRHRSLCTNTFLSTPSARRATWSLSGQTTAF